MFQAQAAEDTGENPDSLFLGVTWDDGSGCWLAELWDGADYARIGSFGTEEAAARAYDRACLAQHGADANTNFPPEARLPPASPALPPGLP